MGIGLSVELPYVLSEIRAWPWDRVETIINKFLTEEYQFGLSSGDIQELTGLDSEKSEELAGCLSRNKHRSVNGVVALCTLVMIADKPSASIDVRKKRVFTIMDFNGLGHITMDELEILLFCVAVSSACILQRKSEIPKSQQIRSIAVKVAERMGKSRNSVITAEEFVEWAEDVARNSPESTIYDVFRYFVPDKAIISDTNSDVGHINGSIKHEESVDSKGATDSAGAVDKKDASETKSVDAPGTAEVDTKIDVSGNVVADIKSADATNNAAPDNSAVDAVTKDATDGSSETKSVDAPGTAEADTKTDVSDNAVADIKADDTAAISAADNSAAGADTKDATDGSSETKSVDAPGDADADTKADVSDNAVADIKAADTAAISALENSAAGADAKDATETEAERGEKGISIRIEILTTNFNIVTDKKEVDEDSLKYPAFTDSHISLMRQNLTPEMFENMKHRHTASGVGLMAHIQSGVNVPSAEVGLTASENESYDTFKEIFDAVIEGYHGVSLSGADSVHVSNQDSSELERMENIDYNYVISSHLRSVRNVKGHQFPTSISSSGRLTLESALMDSLVSMKGEFSGTYQSLRDLGADEKQRLVNNGLLPSAPADNSPYGSAGVGRDWPDGRGVFSNGSSEFAVWINGNDHISVICQNQGGDISAVFEDWIGATNSIERCMVSSGMEFAMSDRLGYLTTCPSNVGTGLRASMVVRLPALGKKEPELHKLCAQCGLTARRVDGSEDHWELGNKATLGKTELEIVQMIVDGVAVAIARNKEIEEDSLKYPAFTDSHISLMRQNLTPEMFENMKHRHTASGVGLMAHIQSGVDVPSAEVGLTASENESYDTFKEIFDAVIEGYHGVSLSGADSVHVSNQDSSELERMENIDYNYVISSHLRSVRNVKGHQFPTSISSSGRLTLESALMDSLVSMKGEFSGTYQSLRDLGADEKQRLVNNGLLPSAPADNSPYGSAGVGRDWPDGRGVFSNGSSEFAVWINGNDHISVICQNQGGDISAVFEDWIGATNSIERCMVSSGMEFAMSDRLGYLTTCPSNVGTGLHASMVVRLPALGKKEPELHKLCAQCGLTARRVDGSEDHWELGNKATLGKTELEIVQMIVDGVAVAIARNKEIEEDSLKYPAFTDSHISLMRQNLTPEMFENMKHRHTASGVGLMAHIQSGVDVPSAEVGLTASENESYDTFKEIFDAVIEGYHGVSLSGADSVHVSNQDSSELERMENIDYNYVISSHLRSVRNVKGHQFPTSISSSGRLTLESALMDSLVSMKGEFSGTYQSLRDLGADEKQRLVNNGLLPSAPADNSPYGSAGVGRDWPDGRGVFSNGSSEFAVWINGNDHISVICQNQGGDISAVFEDWIGATNSIERCMVSSGMEFAMSDRLGYLTTCPSNVGTGLRASMVVRLPALGKKEPELHKLCAQCGLTARRVDGSEDHWELGNKATLGKTELEIVQMIVDGVAVAIARNKEIEEDSLKYPAFTDSHISLMRQNLTPEMFENMKHRHTASGVGLMAHIQSGVDVPSAEVGLTASENESYDTFKEIFDAVIEGYHGVSLSGADSVHVSNQDSSELERMENIDYNYVISSHLRSVRNVKGHQFPTSISSSGRLTLESALMDSLVSMKGEFSGTYQSLRDLGADEKQRLVNNGLLPSAPADNSPYGSAGVGRDWPDGRGVFSNGSSEFAVWINGNDHISVICQNQGGDISAVFEDWIGATNSIERCMVSSGMEFAMSDRLGYLTTCPSNVGTGLRASMVVRLPALGKKEPELHKLCAQCGLTARRVDGSEDHWELGNKATLGKTELEIVQMIVDGVAVAIARNKEIEEDSLKYPAFTDSHISLMRQNLTPEMFENMKHRHTASGVGLMAHIQSGVDVPSAEVGLTASENESYDTFKEIFDAVIEGYHGVSLSGADSVHVSNQDSSELERMENIDYNYVISSHLRSVRNVKGHQFPTSISSSGRLTLESALMDSLVSMKGEFSGTYQSLRDLGADEKQRLVNNGLLPSAPADNSPYGSAGVGRDWPDGRGVFSNGSSEFAVWINGNDHISVICQNQGGDISAVFEDWIGATNSIERCMVSSGMEFAMSDRLGYLTTCPSNVGTGLRASMVVRLPALGKKEPELHKLCAQCGLTARRVDGSEDHWELGNKATLGKTELEIVQMIIDGVAKVITFEKDN